MKRSALMCLAGLCLLVGFTAGGAPEGPSFTRGEDVIYGQIRHRPDDGRVHPKKDAERAAG